MSALSLNKFSALPIAFAIVLINVMIDHFFAPVGILLGPIITIIASVIIIFNKDKFDILFQSVLIFGIISVNDIGLKLYGGGIHDSEGQGVISLLLFISTALCFTILLVFVITNKHTSILKKFTAIVLFLVLMSLHLYFFRSLGLQQAYFQ